MAAFSISEGETLGPEGERLRALGFAFWDGEDRHPGEDDELPWAAGDGERDIGFGDDKAAGAGDSSVL